MNDKHGSTPTGGMVAAAQFPSDEALRDEARIAGELLGTDVGTDPFVAAVRATRMPMIITDPRLPDNPVVFANEAFCRLSGYARDEILGRNCRFLQGEDTDPAPVAEVRRAIERREPIEIDLRNYRKDGSAFWNRLFLAPVFDLRGELAYFFASQLDVTLERERLATLETSNAALATELADRLAEQEESERALRFALAAADFGAWSLDLATHELTTSPTYRRTYGRDPDAPVSYADMHDVVHPDDRARVAAIVGESLTSGQDYNVDHRIILPDGDVRWVNVRARPTHDAAGTAIRIAGVSMDITEQKRAEALRQALVELGDLFRDAPEAAAIPYGAARIVGETLGLTRTGYGDAGESEAVIHIPIDWCAPDVRSLTGQLDLTRYGLDLGQLRRGQTMIVDDAHSDPRTTAEVPLLDGVDARAFVHLPITENGRLVALFYMADRHPRRWRADEVSFAREVAERARIALERRRAEDELAMLAASLEQQVAERTRALMSAEEALRQSQKMEAIGQLTGGVAHDFNNLLTVIRSSVDLMRLPNLAEARRTRYVDAIATTVERATKLTGQLLAFARRQALQPVVFDIGGSIATLSDMIRTLTGSRVDIRIRFPDTPLFVDADPTQFDTAIVNMAVNARDAMQSEGVLTITVAAADLVPPVRAHPARRGDFVTVSIADTGTGIAPGDMERIFEPFFTTKSVGQGTGLGLSQVFGFAKQSGGDVRVESEPGHGATFMLYLPRVDAEALPAPASETDETVPRGGGLTVLVVEDNRDVGTFATQSLGELGYRTVWAKDGNEALAELESNADRFDVVFSDVIMPGMTGIELGGEVRRRYPDLPVVLTSGYSHVLAERGTDGFELLHKPYSLDQLSRILKRVGGKRAG